MLSSTTASPPYAVPCAGAAGSAERCALVSADGRLVRAPELSAVGSPTPAYTGAFDDDGLSRFRARDGHWGYAGTDGIPVIPAALTEAGVFREGLAAVRTEAGAGFLDTSGGFVIRPQYAAAGPFAPNGLAGVRMEDGGRCGYVDRTGRTVIGPRFDGAKPFGPDGVAPVRVGDLWGLIGEHGEWVVEPSFSMLGSFDANGLAFVLGGSVGNHFRGFLNARGEVVIQARDRLSQEFRCGLVRFDDGCAHGYLDATGEEVIEQWYEWAEDFDLSGAAVAHCLVPEEEDSEEARVAAADRPSGRAWGVLRSDERFLPVHHLEPLTDADGRVPGFGAGTGLAAFVTREGGVAHVDRDGLDVCRVVAAADGATVRLVDPAGTTLWENTAAAGSYARVDPAHCAQTHSYLVPPGAPQRDIAELAVELLAAEPRRFEPCSLIFDSREDPYEPSEPQDDSEAADGTWGAMSVVAEVFLHAEHQRDFSFLQDWPVERFGEIEADAVSRLTARFGEPLPGVELCLRSGGGESSTVWQAGDGQLVLQSCFLVGDGDVEIQLWLAAVVDGAPKQC
ncbi:WG repeat-containing protein [Streptomyces sp. NRRL F-2747]|uniref:WG repeat-containing protein n=1 Tax=Streptomyces sp. NRRL F-2747 TaxID=1463843 RepID=UPI0006897ECF|nr:WG repeat-containing protein [Streptomyces sp. NRRL F-2747]